MILELNVENARTQVWKEVKSPVDMSQYTVKQVFFPSKDGTPISMFIVHHTSIELNGTTPLLLYGYGGFNVSLLPSFVSTYVPWLEAGGAFAIPNLRGGGEYGEEWHKAGMLERSRMCSTTTSRPPST